MKQWNHDGWHQDGWQDDGWNNDGHLKKQCSLSDCCMAVREGTDFSRFNQFQSTKNANGKCKIKTPTMISSPNRFNCNKQGFCFATGEGCEPSDCK